MTVDLGGPASSRQVGSAERKLPGAVADAVRQVMRLAGLEPVAALCDVLDRVGELANGTELLALAERLQVPLVAISEIAHVRREEAWSRC